MLTPSEIDNIGFSRALKGYNAEEVDDFLDRLAADYEKLYKQVAEDKRKMEELQSNIDELNSKMSHYKEIEQTLQSTLIIAQTTAADVKEQAQKEAEEIIKDARSQSNKVVDDLRREEIDLTRRIESMKRNFEVFKAKMESTLISQLEMLKDDNDDDE